MYALAFSIVRNEADAGDVISESIYRAYKRFDTLKKMDSFKPWILQIVHNTAVEFVRNNTKFTSLYDVELVTDSRENRLTTALSIRSAVESLAQPYRTIVILYYYENLSIAEISNITSSTIVAVKQQLSRARKQLREILKEDFCHE